MFMGTSLAHGRRERHLVRGSAFRPFPSRGGKMDFASLLFSADLIVFAAIMVAVPCVLVALIFRKGSAH